MHKCYTYMAEGKTAIYRVNPSLGVIRPTGGAPSAPAAQDLWKQSLPLSDSSEMFTVSLPNPWQHYQLGRGEAGMPEDDVNAWTAHPFTFLRPVMNFALWCAGGGLGISSRHLTEGPPLLRAFYRWHLYYHTRRILNRLRYDPNKEGALQGSNEKVIGLDRGLLESIAIEYGVSQEETDYRYPYVFSTDVDGKTVDLAYGDSLSDYTHWLPADSPGLTPKAVSFISESVRVYAYLLLTVQAAARAPLVGPNAAPDAQRLYEQAFEDEVARKVDVAEDIGRFQKTIQNAATPVSYVVAGRAYMLPADMSLHVRKGVAGWSNGLLLADDAAKPGHDSDIAEKNRGESVTPTPGVVTTDGKPKKSEPEKPGKPKKSEPEISHSEELTAVALGVGVAAILVQGARYALG